MNSEQSQSGGGKADGSAPGSQQFDDRYCDREKVARDDNQDVIDIIDDFLWFGWNSMLQFTRFLHFLLLVHYCLPGEYIASAVDANVGTIVKYHSLQI